MTERIFIPEVQYAVIGEKARKCMDMLYEAVNEMYERQQLEITKGKNEKYYMKMIKLLDKLDILFEHTAWHTGYISDEETK